MAPLIGMAAGLIPAISGLITGGRQKRMATAAAAQADVLNGQTLGWANNQLGTAKTLQQQAQNNFNARMAGANLAEGNIYRNQASTLSNMSRGATNSGDLLATAGAVQGQTNAAFNNLSGMEAQEKAQRFGDVQHAGLNIQGAQGNLQNYYGGQAAQAQNSANQLMNASMQNKANAWNQIGSVGMMAGMGSFGDLGSMFQKGIPKSLQGVRNNSYSPFLPATIGNSGLLGGITPNKINFGLIPG